MWSTETVVIGGGPAGAATAARLAAHGREVVLFERTHRPHHKVCGEFLSCDTQACLEALTLDAEALGAVPIHRVEILSGERRAGARLPFRALSLSRFRLDDALLRVAERKGAQIVRGAPVHSASMDGCQWTVKGPQTDIRCRNLVLATGKLPLRGFEDDRDGSFVGLKIHLKLGKSIRNSLAGKMQLAFLDRGYLGLEMVEDDIANACCLLPRERARQFGRNWPALSAYLSDALPALREHFEDAEPLWERTLAVVCPSRGYLHGQPETTTFRIGDRLAHMPPFVGDGLGVALSTALLAADHIARNRPPAGYLVRARSLVARPIRLARGLQRIASEPHARSAMLAAARFAPELLAMLARKTRLPDPVAAMQ